ncbi:hypothetical protein B0H17DRAFT_897772, partial [Mycena rosella]
CRFGCNAVEDAHHVFVECGRYKEWRLKATEELSIFIRDDIIWPLKHTFYYLGHIPSLNDLLPANAVDNMVSHERLLHHFAAEWHLKAIRLTGRIFG